ncbi:protein-glutamine gamma-glutamyltransferase 5 isoform X2 [Conger conger]|uniref:protein-glutamine gamma-glutamyltransferase 5 isoform X2 n=1 Tax=Conger conger TaxID=82655 RepID=UPI002A5B065E|nr:protein-glutamine gamma-glutamyltransferase 5 isoform X2 [Conger conger]
MYFQDHEARRQREGLSLGHVNLELWENLEAHHTQGLASRELVLRRGQPFKLTLLFKHRTFNPHNDSLHFKAVMGDLFIEFPATISKGLCPEWGAQVQLGGVHPQSVTVLITSSPQAPVGTYSLQLCLLALNWQQNYAVANFTLLCNPWCQLDAVHIPFEDQRKEYVKNDFGLLYMGTPHNVISRPWAFSLYERGILEICLDILQVSPHHGRDRQKDYLYRADPVYLSRVVCAMINCEDDRGVLRGNWSGNFEGGVRPSEWTGSADILKRWAGSRFKPVQFGQCWVYAAVMCTVMRILGVPTRVVTNFNSAHDTNGNLIIEEFYTEAGEKLNLSNDSIWNFHVWVECWMTRPDLGTQFGGWQVLDPTPQEKSGGLYCCGPCPVAAIRQRRVDLAFDARFVYAEVNADVLRVVMANGRVLDQSLDTEHVGSRIYTKSIGTDKPQDITCAYKSQQGTKQHSKCNQRCKHSLDVSLSIDMAAAGEDITFSVTIANKEGLPRVLREHANAQAKAYNHGFMTTFWELHNRLQIAPRGVLTIRHHIPHSQMELALGADALVNLAVVIEDERTWERALVSEELNITSPEISFQVADGDDLVQNKDHTVLVAFTNPFSTPLCSAMLTVEGFGLIEQKVQSIVYLLQPGKTMEETVTITPKEVGTKILQASLVFKNSPAVIRSFHVVSVSTL